MARTGTTPRHKTLKEQRKDGELELIIEDFAGAMRNACRGYVARPAECSHDIAPRFTWAMDHAWANYVEFCRRNPK